MEGTHSPVTTRPMRNSGRSALMAMMAGVLATASTSSPKSIVSQSRRHGKHHGQTKGAFGKQQ